MNPLVLAAVMAIGQSPDGGSEGQLFLEFSGGVNWYEDALNVSIDSGGFISFGVGYEWELNPTLYISVEGEYSYHDGDAQGSFEICEDYYCRDVRFDGDLESHAFMINVGLRQALFGDGGHDGFFVYGILGIGISRNEGEVTFTGSSHKSLSSQTFKASGNELAWQAGLGAGYQFNSHWSAKGGVRYFDGGSVVDDLGIDAESFILEFGFSYGF